MEIIRYVAPSHVRVGRRAADGGVSRLPVATVGVLSNPVVAATADEVTWLTPEPTRTAP